MVDHVSRQFKRLRLLPQHAPVPRTPTVQLFPSSSSANINPYSRVNGPLFRAFVVAIRRGHVTVVAVVNPKRSRVDQSPYQATSSAARKYNVQGVATLPVPNVPRVIGPFPTGLHRVREWSEAFRSRLHISDVDRPFPIQTVATSATIGIVLLHPRMSFISLVGRFIQAARASNELQVNVRSFYGRAFLIRPSLSKCSFSVTRHIPNGAQFPLFRSATPRHVRIRLSRVVFFLSSGAGLSPIANVTLRFCVHPTKGRLQGYVPVDEVILLFTTCQLRCPSGFLVENGLDVRATLQHPCRGNFLPKEVLMPIPIPTIRL